MKMKTNNGSTLLITVVIVALLSMTLAIYLSLVGSQNAATSRSQIWNKCIPVAEAGIEEALSHLSVNGMTNLDREGWTQTSGLYWMRRPLGDSYYVVTISNYVAGSPTVPVIESRGYSKSYISTNIYASPAYLTRGVRITTRPLYMFTKAVLVKNSVDINGNNVMVDSFDSTNPLYSTNGHYIASKHRANGDVSVNSSIINSLNIGNANIFGSVSTGPTGQLSIGPQGVVGDLAWHTSHTGVEPGFFKNDMNVTINDVQVPFNGGYFTPNGTSGWITNASGVGVHYDYILNSGNYQTDTLNGSVYINGNVTLYVTTSLSMSQLSVNTNDNFNLYSSAASVSIVGNDTGLAGNFSYYGLPSNTSMALSGNGTIAGTVYAPECAISMNGGGKNNTDFVGAMVAASVKFNGHFNLHYDESLANIGSISSHVVTSWNEMTPQEVASLPSSVGN